MPYILRLGSSNLLAVLILVPIVLLLLFLVAVPILILIVVASIRGILGMAFSKFKRKPKKSKIIDAKYKIRQI